MNTYVFVGAGAEPWRSSSGYVLPEVPSPPFHVDRISWTLIDSDSIEDVDVEADVYRDGRVANVAATSADDGAPVSMARFSAADLAGVYEALRIAAEAGRYENW